MAQSIAPEGTLRIDVGGYRTYGKLVGYFGSGGGWYMMQHLLAGYNNKQILMVSISMNQPNNQPCHPNAASDAATRDMWMLNKIIYYCHAAG